jgi:Fur family peroxide stress response transcriptional regulator
MTNHILEKLKQKGLKITPQRIAVYESVLKLKNHPTADNVTEYIRKNNPNVSVGTVYKVLDTFVKNGLLKKD